MQVEVYEEEGERERLRLQEAEVEVFSLQAELESALTEIGEMEAEKIILRERQESNKVKNKSFHPPPHHPFPPFPVWAS